MVRRLLSCLALAALASCAAEPSISGDGGPTAPDAGASAHADELLRQSDLVGAGDAYRKVMVAAPADSHAAFGAALTSLLMIPDDNAITSLLDTCGLPHVDVAHQIFGSTGLLARDADARAGAATLTTGRRQGDSGDFVPVAFAPESLRTTVEQVMGRAGTERHLHLRVQDVSFAGGRQSAELDIDVSFSAAALDPGGSPHPLADGLQVSADQFAGTFSFSLPSANGLVWEYFYRPVSGSIVFDKVGTGAAGDAVHITLDDLVLEGQPSTCDPVCTAQDWPYLRLNGTLSDTVSPALKLVLPFDALADDAGPPHRAELIVLIDRCPGISAETLRAHLSSLLTSLETIDAELAVVLKDPNAEAFQFRMPGGLFFVAGEVPLNIADARVAKTTIDLALALGHGATQYRTLAKRFDELLGTYDFWSDSTGVPSATSERSFVAHLLVDELNAVFLDREPGFSLSAASGWLIAALDAGSAALTREPKNAGLLDFQTINARDFSTDLNDQLSFVRTSISTPGAQGFPHSPDFLLSLKTALDSPIDITSLHKASQTGAGVFTFHAGLPGALPARDRNDWRDFDGDAVKKAAAPIFALPPDHSATACSDLAPCDGDYRCQPDLDGLNAHCQAPGFVFLDKGAVGRALPSTGDPAFVNTDALRPLRVLQ